MAVANYNAIDVNAGIALKAAGLVATDTFETAVYLGRGMFIIDITWTAAEIASGDELYNVQFQANTEAVTGTWYDLMSVPFGASSTPLGGAAATGTSGTMRFAIINPYDNEVRVNTFVAGTIATGFNFAVTAYHPSQVGF